MTPFSILDNIKKKEKIKLSFEYFWKYSGKWSIFHNTFEYMIFHICQKALLCN